MSQQGWTALTYLALIAGVLAIVGMLGVPQMHYDDSTKQQIVQFVGSIATTAAGYALRHTMTPSEPKKEGE